MELPPKAMRIAEILDNKKANDIVLLDVHDLTIIADCFVVADATNENHVKMLAEEVQGRLAKDGTLPHRTEGENEGRWIVIDYDDVLVHIFHKAERQFYQLERLWVVDDNMQKYSELRAEAAAPSPES